MSIIVQDPPEGSLEIIKSALDTFRTQSNFAAELTAESSAAGNLNLAAPHPIYFVGLKDLAKGKLLSTAKLKGWKYLLLNENEPYATAQLNSNRKKLVFSHINQGILVERTVRALAFAENLEEVNENDYELRLIDVPGLYVAALWLHGENDLIIPLLLGSFPIDKFIVYTEGEFIDLLQDKSSARLQFDETSTEKEQI